eukprot:1144545-Pelagomonas_calceolata.AAC.1
MLKAGTSQLAIHADAAQDTAPSAYIPASRTPSLNKNTRFVWEALRRHCSGTLICTPHVFTPPLPRPQTRPPPQQRRPGTAGIRSPAHI